MAKKIRRRNSRGSGFLLLIIFLALAVAGGFFYASSKDATKKNIEDGKQKVQSTDLDLRGRSKSAHAALDSIFASKTSLFKVKCCGTTAFSENSIFFFTRF